RAFKQPTSSLEAHDLVLRGRALVHRGGRGPNREARLLLARAVEIAPDYGDAYAVLGNAEFQRVTNGWVENPVETAARAEELGKRALLSPDANAHARAHSLLAMIYLHLDRFEEALKQADHAIELNPSDYVALNWRGSSLLGVGRIDEA